MPAEDHVYRVSMFPSPGSSRTVLPFFSSPRAFTRQTWTFWPGSQVLLRRILIFVGFIIGFIQLQDRFDDIVKVE